MSLRTCLCMLLLPIIMTSCALVSKRSVFQNREKDYLAAESIPPLRIPPGISSETMHSYYPVSDRVYPGDKYVSLTPPGLYSPEN